MYSQTSQKCPECKGQGEIMKEADRCSECKGEKIKKVAKELEVAIEPGCPHDHDYIFTGEGDEYPNIIPGDIYVRIKIAAHKIFLRKGVHLVMVTNITLTEALTGVTRELKHLDGGKFVLATAPGEILSNNQLKMVKGLGMPFYKDRMSHGNLLVDFKVEFPKKLSKAQVEEINHIAGKPKDKHTNEKRDSKTHKILEDFKESDLNPKPNPHMQTREESSSGGIRFTTGGGGQSC
jgi:DnaJ family protein A protein 2